MAFVLAAKEDIRLAIEALSNLLHSYQEIYSVPYTAEVLECTRDMVYSLIKSKQIRANRLDDRYRSSWLVDARSVHLYKQKRDAKRARLKAKKPDSNI